MKKVEIEKKFLLKNWDGVNPFRENSYIIEQIYLTNNIRYRETIDTITGKTQYSVEFKDKSNEMVREEYLLCETELGFVKGTVASSFEEFKQRYPYLRKTRKTFNMNDITDSPIKQYISNICVDTYIQDTGSELVRFNILEIEYNEKFIWIEPSIDSEFGCIPPDFRKYIDKEVTNDSKYYSYNIALNNFNIIEYKNNRIQELKQELEQLTNQRILFFDKNDWQVQWLDSPEENKAWSNLGDCDSDYSEYDSSYTNEEIEDTVDITELNELLQDKEPVIERTYDYNINRFSDDKWFVYAGTDKNGNIVLAESEIDSDLKYFIIKKEEL